MASPQSAHFTCPHIELAKNASPPIYQAKLTCDQVKSYPSDDNTKVSLQSICPPENFSHIVQLSDSCYAIYTEPNTGTPTGYTHVVQKSDSAWHCFCKACSKKSGATKQVKTKHLCLHLHLLFCHLSMSAEPIIAGPSQPAECLEEDNEMSTSRASTIKLNRSRSIPYPFPTSGLQFCQVMQQRWPTMFCPSETMCKLCDSRLAGLRLHPGQNVKDTSYIITPCCIFQQVEIKVKVCSNSKCKAMYQVWPIEQGEENTV